MKLSEELEWRGYAHQFTFKNLAEVDNKKIVVYLGTDPSGESLHIGHLASQMLARCFLEHGAKVILLIGGGTGQVGDPRDTNERDLISIEDVEANKKALAKQVSQLFGGQDFELVDNAEWLSDVNLLDFLRDTGKYFSMGQLIDREHFKARVGEGKSGMSFAEFSYTLLQGYDYWNLYKNYGVNLQIGGSDQWGNILSGVDLVRKKEGVEVDALTVNLVIDPATGRKFGKSESGEGVWLAAKKTSPYKFYQFWLNVSDEGSIQFLKLYTRLDRSEIEQLDAKMQDDPSTREAQKALAFAVTKLVHGEETASAVRHASEALFGRDELSEKDFEILASELPTAEVGVSVVEALVQTGLASSNGEALRLIKGNGVSLNDVKLTEDQKITQRALLKKGKNSFVLVK
ncbi:tyrosine--tRNA ligase [Candidatus Saccharibacteria bacterium]|nr:tyrosine--tRNA ligase [Candidatus Saccharibacteria bacterium]